MLATPIQKHSELLFKKITGLTPVEYRNKYNKMSFEKHPSFSVG